MATADLDVATPQAQRARSERRHRSGGRRLLEAFAAFDEFPALVAARHQVLALRPGSLIGSDVISAVESDLALTVGLLRRANGGGKSKRIATIAGALAAIGEEGLREAAATTSSFELFQSSGPWGQAPESHRVHATATQRAAGRLAAVVSYPRTDELFVAALLHDIGKLVLAYAYPRYAEVPAAADLAAERRAEHERRLMGMDHALVGGVLARRWGLPHELARVIERHHVPTETGLAGMVRLADMIAHYEAGDAVDGALMEEAAANVGLPAPGLQSLLTAPATSESRSRLPCPLTPSEQRVVFELANGLLYKEIARLLGLSVSTVRTHLHNTYRKLGVSDRAQAVLLAREHNWI